MQLRLLTTFLSKLQTKKRKHCSAKPCRAFACIALRSPVGRSPSCGYPSTFLSRRIFMLRDLQLEVCDTLGNSCRGNTFGPLSSSAPSWSIQIHLSGATVSADRSRITVRRFFSRPLEANTIPKRKSKSRETQQVPSESVFCEIYQQHLA